MQGQTPSTGITPASKLNKEKLMKTIGLIFLILFLGSFTAAADPSPAPSPKTLTDAQKAKRCAAIAALPAADPNVIAAKAKWGCH